MRHWFKDQHFRSLLKNSSYLAASRVVAAIASVATAALAAHALGLLLFGALILIDSYARAVSGIAKFQSWQLIVRYGGRALHGEADDFKTSTGFAFALDVITSLGGELYGWFIAWRELRRRGLLEGIRPTLKPETLPGAWRFAINVNLNASVQAAWGPIARLVVGGLLGRAGAALFRVASSLSDSASKPADLLAKAFYPEVVRMDLTTKKPWKLMLRGTALASALGLVAILILLLGGKPIVSFLFGKDFLGAYDALVILMVVPFLSVFSFPLPPMLYALDRSDGPLKARIAGAIIYFVIIAPLSWRFGVNGAAIAFVVGNAATVIAMMWQLRGEHRRVRGSPAR